jgi:hypothetical protein
MAGIRAPAAMQNKQVPCLRYHSNLSARAGNELLAIDQTPDSLGQLGAGDQLIEIPATQQRVLQHAELRRGNR